MTYVVGDAVVLAAGGIARMTASMSIGSDSSLWDVVARLTPVAAAALARQTSSTWALRLWCSLTTALFPSALSMTHSALLPR